MSSLQFDCKTLSFKVMLLALFAALVSARHRKNGLESMSHSDKAKVLNAALNVAALQLDDDEEEAPKEHQLQRLIKMAVDNPLEDFLVEDPGKKLKQARMLRQKALARARQIRLRKMKLAKKNRAKMQRVMRGPEPAQVETVVKVDSPFMMHDVMEPVQVPGKRMRGAKQRKERVGSG